MAARLDEAATARRRRVVRAAGRLRHRGDAGALGRVGEAAALAATELGYPVVLKTDDPAIAHKSDVGGVVLGLADEAAVRAAYDELAARLGPRALVCATATAGCRAVGRPDP